MSKPLRFIYASKLTSMVKTWFIVTASFTMAVSLMTVLMQECSLL